MDDARKKLRVCLLCVVAAAVIIGCIYFFNDIKSQNQVSEGTLVLQDVTGHNNRHAEGRDRYGWE